MGKKENAIEQYLRRECEVRGWLCWKFKSPGHNGAPDRLIIGNDKTCFVETKAPDEKTRELQDFQHQRMRERGAIVFVADTKPRVDEVIAWIER